MRNILVSLLMCGIVSGIHAQDQSDSKFTRDADGVFEFLAGQAGIGFLGDMRAFLPMVQKYGLQRVNGGETVGSAWSLWQAENNTGKVTTYASFPGPLDKTHNVFWVRFDPATETPLPAPMLTHLLAKAKETPISGGDSIEVKMPSEQVLSGCVTRNTLRIRITTGALLSNTIESYCPVIAK